MEAADAWALRKREEARGKLLTSHGPVLAGVAEPAVSVGQDVERLRLQWANNAAGARLGCISLRVGHGRAAVATGDPSSWSKWEPAAWEATTVMPVTAMHGVLNVTL